MSPAQIATFAALATRYWLTVFPRACRELRAWRRRAEAIPDPVLRRLALEALAKRGNIEGAAAFAVFSPWRRRGAVVRALVAFQAAYNYADTLAEEPSVEPVENARRLHAALLVALDRGVPHPDFYAYHPQRGDDGFMAAMVDACRDALAGLPSWAVVVAPARAAAERVVGFQSLSLGDRDALERWARAQVPAGAALAWWEAAAAAGSSLGVHALIASAATRSLRAESVAELERAYFPWVGALHSLLDSILDEAEDAATGQLSLVGCYPGRAEAAQRMRWLTAQALERMRAFPEGRRHSVMVAAMACHYLSDPRAKAPEARAAAHGVTDALGGLALPPLLVFGVRRLVERLPCAVAGGRARRGVPPVIRLADGERGVDAGAV
jgi:tetraprenyl-beta-curcumene synthase